MAIVGVLKQGLRIAGRIDRKYNINKIFVEKYVPPHLRSRTRKIIDIAGTLGGSYGLIRFIESLYAPDTPGNYAAPLPRKEYTKTYKSNKTRYRQTSRTRRKCKQYY